MISHTKDESIKLMRELSKIPGSSFGYTPLDIGTESKRGHPTGDTRFTWETIKNMIDFKDRVVIDVGACCGFFVDKMLEFGAREAWAVEINNRSCQIMEAIHKFNIGDNRLHIFNGNWMDFKLPIVDGKFIITVLNITHHFYWDDHKKTGDYRKEAISKVFSFPFSYIIFECVREDSPIVEEVAAKYRVEKFASIARPERDVIVVYD